MEKKYITLLIIILALFCLNLSNAQPTSATFIGGGGDNFFSTAANWSPSGIPITNSSIIIDWGKNIIIDMDYTCSSLTINNDASFSCIGGHVLTITEGVYDGNGRKAIDIRSSLRVMSEIKIPATKYGIFTDYRDDQKYNWVIIDAQVWMAENLNFYTPTGSWYYNNDSATYAATYGRLYNWDIAMAGAGSSNSTPSGVQGVCPTGWHLPSDAEWTNLMNFLGGLSEAGGKLKETGSTHWLSPNYEATNESGFTALPGGDLHFSGDFYNIGQIGVWWSSTESDEVPWWGPDKGSWYYYTYWGNKIAFRNYFSKAGGLSVRCVKN